VNFGFIDFLMLSRTQCPSQCIFHIAAPPDCTVEYNAHVKHGHSSVCVIHCFS
jgi:hypothetical protein